MNSLIKYGLYFVVAFSVLAFGAAEDGKTEGSLKGEVEKVRRLEDGERTDVGGQKWKQQDGWMIRMIRMNVWKQLDMERGKNKEGLRDKLFELAICDFERNLEKFRKLCPVKTICMHGSPLSK